MVRCTRSSGRAALIGLSLALLAGSVIGFTLDRSRALAQEAAVLLVNDAETANPELVTIEVADPGGFGVSGQTLLAPEGYSVSVVAAGLDEPRFMAFDEAGNLIVTSSNEGAIYRYPFADGLLGEPEPLISGLNWPASVALFAAEDGQYLYVGSRDRSAAFPTIQRVRPARRK